MVQYLCLGSWLIWPTVQCQKFKPSAKNTQIDPHLPSTPPPLPPRLLPLLDDFFECEDLEFSTKKIFRYSLHSSYAEESLFSHASSSIGDNDDDDDDVGFYLDSNSPSEQRERIGDSSHQPRWVPYFGDPKGALVDHPFAAWLCFV